MTKVDFCRRYSAGEFGNHSPTWDTKEEWDQSGATGLFHLRNRVAGGPTWYNLNAIELEIRWRWLVYQGQRTDLYYISSMAPMAQTLIQGEIQQSERHLDLRYSTVALPMREALAQEQFHESGAVAVTRLKYYMDSTSWDWVQYLICAYPEHVIEFSVYGVNWGTVPYRNTVIWEVRKY